VGRVRHGTFRSPQPSRSLREDPMLACRRPTACRGPSIRNDCCESNWQAAASDGFWPIGEVRERLLSLPLWFPYSVLRTSSCNRDFVLRTPCVVLGLRTSYDGLDRFRPEAAVQPRRSKRSQRSPSARAAIAIASRNELSRQSVSPILCRKASHRGSAWSERNNGSGFMTQSPGSRCTYARSSQSKA